MNSSGTTHVVSNFSSEAEIFRKIVFSEWRKLGGLSGMQPHIFRDGVEVLGSGLTKHLGSMCED